jgi:hypothetical protein
VFTLTRPAAAVIQKQIAAAVGLPSIVPPMLSLASGLDQTERLLFGFAHDFSRSQIGRGESAFAAAKSAFQQWAMFDLGWVRVANPEALIDRDRSLRWKCMPPGFGH